MGPNNIGLLVQVCGKVTSIDSDSFYVDDGSRLVEVLTPAGVTVLLGNSYVAVMGISSCRKSGADILPLLRVRKQVDIAPLEAP